MRVICAWCPAVIHEGAPPPAPVSHGCCPACVEKLEAELEVLKKGAAA